MQAAHTETELAALSRCRGTFMDSFSYGTPPRRWDSLLSPLFLHFFRPIRQFWQQHLERLMHVDVQRLEHLRGPVDDGCGVVVVSNHAAHADPFVFLNVADQLGRLFSYMVAWQSFQILNRVERRVLQRHGCFSVNREGKDVGAFRRAVEVVQEKPNPLVLFAEGEVYHQYERIAPFRTGAAAIALAAARRAQRRIVCVPAAITYRYLEDPTPELGRVLNALERKLRLPPGRHVTLATRIRHVAEGVLAAREQRYLGRAQTGRFASRAASLLEAILRRLEERAEIGASDDTIPDRVTRLRRLAIEQKESATSEEQRVAEAERHLHDLYVVTQLYSYLGDYQTNRPTMEHLAEIVEKFEEDVLGVTTAHGHGKRRGMIRFGPPITVPARAGGGDETGSLTATLEASVRGLLRELIEDSGPWATQDWGPYEGQP